MLLSQRLIPPFTRHGAHTNKQYFYIVISWEHFAKIQKTTIIMAICFAADCVHTSKSHHSHVRFPKEKDTSTKHGTFRCELSYGTSPPRLECGLFGKREPVAMVTSWPRNWMTSWRVVGKSITHTHARTHMHIHTNKLAPQTHNYTVLLFSDRAPG